MSEIKILNVINIECSCGSFRFEVQNQCESTTITCSYCGAVLILKDGRY